MTGIAAFEDDIENTCSIYGGYFLTNGPGDIFPTIKIRIQYMIIMPASPKTNVPNIAKTESSTLTPKVRIIEVAEQKTAMGMILIISDVTLRKRSLRA